MKRTPLTENQFKLLQTTDGWNIDEVPKEHWDKIPGIERLHDTFGILASGTCSDPKILNSVSSIVGFDVLAHESNPNTAKNEPAGNAYHYVIQKLERTDYPYLMHGPFRKETLVDHWFDYEDINRYWRADNA